MIGSHRREVARCPRPQASLVAWATTCSRDCVQLFVHIHWEHDGLRLAMGTEEHRLAVAPAEPFEQAGQPFAGLADRQDLNTHSLDVPECVHKMVTRRGSATVRRDGLPDALARRTSELSDRSHGDVGLPAVPADQAVVEPGPARGAGAR